MRQSYERNRFILEPGEKYPLDQVYYENNSFITVRVIDQNSIEIPSLATME